MSSDPFAISNLLGSLPSDLVNRLGNALARLPEVGYRDLAVSPVSGGLAITVLLVPPNELALLPFGASSFGIRVGGEVPAWLRLTGTSAHLRLEPTILFRVPPELLRSEQGGLVEISCSLRLQADWSDGQPLTYQIDAPDGVSLPLCEIGRSGFRIAIESLQLSLNPDDPLPQVVEAGFAEAFIGVWVESAELRLPSWLAVALPAIVQMQDAAIGTAGFSGSATVDFPAGSSGSLFGLPLEIVQLTISVTANSFDASRLTGRMQVPFLGLPIDFMASFDVEGRSLGLAVTQTFGFSVGTALAGADIDRLDGAATLSEEGFALGGTLTNLHARLGGLLAADIASATFTLEHANGASRFQVDCGQATFGPLGMLDDAALVLEQSAAGNRASLSAAMSWSQLAARIAVPAEFPVPVAGSRVAVTLEAVDHPGAAASFVLRGVVETAMLDLAFLDVFPIDARPEFRNAAVQFEISFADEAALRAAPQAGSLVAALTAFVEFRLPGVPYLLPPGFLTISAGDPAGWVRAGFSVSITAGAPRVSLDLLDPLAFALNLPVLEQPQPPLQLAVRRLHVEAVAAGASLAVEADFTLTPPAPPPSFPLAADLAHLLQGLYLQPLAGTASLALAFAGSRTAMTLDAVFSNAGVTLDVFAMLASLGQGRPSPDGGTRGEVPLSLNVGFALKALKLQLGSLNQDGPNAQFEIIFGAFFGAIGADAFFRLSDAELVFGIVQLDVPLTMPEMPVTAADLAALRENPAAGLTTWTRWQTTFDTLTMRIAAIDPGSGPASRRELAALQARFFLLQLIHGVFTKVRPANRPAYQEYTEMMIGLAETATLAFHSDSRVRLEIRNLEVRVPFSDPRGVAVQGSARFAGLSGSDPLKPLETVTLTAGLSADQIYFSLDSTGRAIPIPLSGRYSGGEISFTRISLGYGFTKNSIAAAFAGELHLPRQLTLDADTSRALGAGLRLPQHSAVNFRIDIIPVPGPIPAVPAFEFNIDLRSPATPGLASVNPCTPFWDGLQLIIPGVVRADLKQIAASPFFGPFPLPNVRFDADIELGSGGRSLTVIVDNLIWLPGIVSPPTTIPFLADPTQPFFDNLCIHLRLAGFGVNFDIERPFPSFQPLAILEVLGLLADPMMQLDADGPLANTIRVALKGAEISIPQPVRRIFPDLNAINRKDLNVTLNLGTVVGAMQEVARVLAELKSAFDEAGPNLRAVERRLRRQPLSLRPSALLALLPPEMRKFRSGGSLAGFDARAVIVLIAPDDVPEEFRRRRDPSPPPGDFRPQIGQTADPAALARFRPNIPPGASLSGPSRVYDPSDPRNRLFKGREFDGFSASDLAVIASPQRPGAPLAAGAVVGAHVKVFGGQRFRFLGYLFEDGSFGLATALDVRPLRLRVNGISIEIPLAIEGRMLLTGRARRDGVRGSIQVNGRASWAFLNVAHLEIAPKKVKPAQLQLYSDGRFSLRGSAIASLFQGSALVNGSVDISHTHCFLQGQLSYEIRDVVSLKLNARGRFGPGPVFELAGDGELRILGQLLTEVRGRVTQNQASFDARLDTGGWRLLGNSIKCEAHFALAGSIDLRKRAKASFSLEGKGSLSVFGAEIQGRGGIVARSGQVRLFAEGALSWQNRKWLQGSVEVDSRRVRVAGRTSFAVNLTPASLAGIDLAHLFLQVEIDGSFALESSTGMAGFSVHGSWMIGARVSSGDSPQVLPLAADRFGVNMQEELAIDLVHMQGIQLVPFQGVQIPVPKITTTGSLLRVGFVNGNMAMSWKGKQVELIQNVFPWITDDTLSASQTKIKLGGYTVSLDFENMKDISLPLTGDFSLALVWRGGLALRTTTAGHSDNYLYL